MSYGVSYCFHFLFCPCRFAHGQLDAVLSTCHYYRSLPRDWKRLSNLIFFIWGGYVRSKLINLLCYFWIYLLQRQAKHFCNSMKKSISLTSQRFIFWLSFYLASSKHLKSKQGEYRVSVIFFWKNHFFESTWSTFIWQKMIRRIEFLKISSIVAR